MKREPNPYAQQRTYTVTQTMAISVPSVVAEDVLDGIDMPSTSVDPAINGRIDAISGVVELMGTRIDGVSDMTSLLNDRIDDVSDMTSLLNDRIDDVSADLSGRIDAVSEVLALHGSGSSGPISTLSGFSGSDAHYNQSTGLDYKLGLGLTYDTHQAYLIVKNGDSADWQPLQLESGSSSVHPLESPSVTTTSDKLYRLEFSQENSFIYALSQQYDTSELAYCDGIACNYFRDPVGALGLHHAEMRFQTNTSSAAIEIQLRGDASSNWITVASTANTSSSEAGGDISFSTSGGTNYSLGFEADSISNDYSAIVSLKSTGSNEFSGIIALGTWLCSTSYTAGNENVFMSVSGMGELVFKSGSSTVKYDLSNLGGDSGSSAPVVTVVDSDAVEAKQLALLRLNDATDSNYGYVRNYRLTNSEASSSTAVTYALQMFLAATGIHETVGKSANQAAQTRIALVEGASQSSTPQFMWWDSGAYTYKKWEPWKEDESSSSGGSSSSDSSFYWQETNKSSTSIVAVLSYPGYSDKDAVLIDNPLYAGQYNSRPCAVRPYISSDGTLLSWKRREESGSWATIGTSGSAAGVYELGLLDNGNDSGSHMVPLVEESSVALGNGRSLITAKWSIGASTQEAKDLSGVYTLMANPLALFGHHYNSIDDMHITGAIRPMVTSNGALAWQKLNYSTKQWNPINYANALPITNALATADYGTLVSYLTVENVGNAYSMAGMNNYADDQTFKQKSWEPTRLQTIELGGKNESNEFSGIVALRNYLAVPVKTPVGDKIRQQAPTNTEHVIMGVHNMGVLQFSSGMDYNSYQTFKIDLSPFMPSLHGSTEPITSKMRWLLNNTEKLAALLDS